MQTKTKKYSRNGHRKRTRNLHITNFEWFKDEFLFLQVCCLHELRIRPSLNLGVIITWEHGVFLESYLSRLFQIFYSLSGMSFRRCRLGTEPKSGKHIWTTLPNASFSIQNGFDWFGKHQKWKRKQMPTSTNLSCRQGGGETGRSCTPNGLLYCASKAAPSVNLLSEILL